MNELLLRISTRLSSKIFLVAKLGKNKINFPLKTSLKIYFKSKNFSGKIKFVK